ncbi:MAG: DUF3570 domain-containing protein [Bdellovibrionales bacterium]|nr:DUF3570 domain-containing protein [Bdellovibrionales bacterium]
MAVTKKSFSRGEFLSAISAAAAVFPIVRAPESAFAQSIAEEGQFRFQYSYYEDRQGSDDRISVRAPMVWALTPLGDSTELEGSFVLDTVSGASPLHHDTLSGASGIGIEDERKAGDIKVTEYFEDFSVAVGGNYSREDDYTSAGGSVESRIWNSTKSTTFTIGMSRGADDISSTNNPDLDESSDTTGGIFGVTQVINKVSLIQSNLTFSSSNGYLSDPYKPGDLRPESRDRFAWLTRYVLYVPDFDGSLHVDYRFYRDSWGVLSHTFDNYWYQPIGELWMLRPHIRFYSQGKADFYRNTFPAASEGEIYSADQRLAGFGELTTGLKVIRDFGEGFSMSLSGEFIQQHGGWKIGSPGSPGLESFYETFFSFGLAKKF